MNWRNDLDPDFQQRLRGLEACGCEFLWRKDLDSLAQQTPMPDDPAIFEVWRHGQLLDFIYPVRHPFDLYSSVQIERLIMREWRIYYFLN